MNVTIVSEIVTFMQIILGIDSYRIGKLLIFVTQLFNKSSIGLTESPHYFQFDIGNIYYNDFIAVTDMK